MKTEKQIRELRDIHARNLAMWCEPDGYLIRTEPDADERRMVRERLKAAIETCDRILADWR